MICDDCIHFSACKAVYESMGYIIDPAKKGGDGLKCKCYDSKEKYQKINHAEWVSDGCMYKCSNCGNLESYYTDSYCRCCGSKMDL